MTSATPAGSPAPRDTILSIQVVRGIAAAAVSVYHAHLILAQPQYGGIDVFGAIAAPGWLGVNFFFVLSGFIILHAHRGDIGRPERLPRYLWKRFTRVYPIYWVLLTVFIIAATEGLGNAQFARSVSNLLSSYLLVELTPALSLPLQVAWTLIYEVRFYALFALLILDRRLGFAALTLWIAGIAIGMVWTDPRSLSIFHVWNVYFLFGMATYCLNRIVPARYGPAILIAGCVLLLVCIASGIVRHHVAESTKGELLLFVLPFSLILLGAVLTERSRLWRPAGGWLLLGEASYSIYLVHSAAITLVAIVARKLSIGAEHASLLFIATVAVSIVAGVLVHYVVERPIMRTMRMVGRRSIRAAAPPLEATKAEP